MNDLDVLNEVGKTEIKSSRRLRNLKLHSNVELKILTQGTYNKFNILRKVKCII